MNIEVSNISISNTLLINLQISPQIGEIYLIHGNLLCSSKNSKFCIQIKVF